MTCSTSGALTCTIEGLDDGTYSATAIATNAAGSSSASDPPTVFRIRTRNQVPTATLELSQATGVAPLDTTATVSATDADNDPLTYTLDFGDGTEVASGALPVAPVAHRYASSGVWTVRLAVSDGLETTIETSTVSVGSSEPLRAVAGDDITATVGAAISFDGSASRPLVGIDSYSWTFGDGSPAQPGAIVSHTFTQAGTWTVTLTVGQGTSTDSTTLTATVIPVLGAPSLAITVTETGGATIPGADVVVIDASGTRYAATTDNAGVAHLDGLADGSYTAYGWHDGYQPGTAPVAVSGGTGQANLVLPAGAVAQTSVEATPLTADQAQAAGIDTSDPGNQNVFQFEIHLAVTSDATEQVAFTGYTTSGNGFVQPTFSGGSGSGGGSGGGGSSACGAVLCTAVGNFTVYPSLHYVASQPSIVWMVVPGQAKWLKEFLDVRLLVSNLASPAFTFENGKASLGDLPSGLSLAATATPQSLIQDMPDIPEALRLACAEDPTLGLDLDHASYFLSRISIRLTDAPQDDMR